MLHRHFCAAEYHVLPLQYHGVIERFYSKVSAYKRPIMHGGRLLVAYSTSRLYTATLPQLSNSGLEAPCSQRQL